MDKPKRKASRIVRGVLLEVQEALTRFMYPLRAPSIRSDQCKAALWQVPWMAPNLAIPYFTPYLRDYLGLVGLFQNIQRFVLDKESMGLLSHIVPLQILRINIHVHKVPK